MERIILFFAVFLSFVFFGQVCFSETVHHDVKISQKDMISYVNHRSVIEEIRHLIIKDSQTKYSEIGGVVTILGEGKNVRFSFVDIESSNAQLCQEILEHADNLSYLRELHKKNLEVFKDSYGPYEKNFWKTYGQIHNIPHNNAVLIDEMKFYLKFSRGVYEITRKQVVSAFEQGIVVGNFFGIFSIHQDGSEPSYQELQASNLVGIRGIIIAKRENGCVIYDLFRGQINSVIRLYFDGVKDGQKRV